jgi:hypothetical protein
MPSKEECIMSDAPHELDHVDWIDLNQVCRITGQKKPRISTDIRNGTLVSNGKRHSRELRVDARCIGRYLLDHLPPKSPRVTTTAAGEPKRPRTERDQKDQREVIDGVVISSRAEVLEFIRQAEQDVDLREKLSRLSAQEKLEAIQREERRQHKEAQATETEDFRGREKKRLRK